MPITINGNGTLAGISAGGYPDGTVTADDLAATLDLSGKTLTGVGKVLQVVSAIKKDTASTASTSAVATGLELSITPTASTSKILLTASVGCSGTANNDFGVFYYFGLGGSVITDALGDAASARTRCGTFARSSNTTRGYSSVMVYEHDHNSSSQLTYSLMFSVETNSTAFFNQSGNDADSAARPRTFSTLTAMEISA